MKKDLALLMLILFVFGSQYNASIIVLQVLIWSVIPMVIGNTYGSLILISKGYFKQYLWAVAVGALVNVAINLMLIPLLGAVGSAIAMIAACFVSGFLTLYFSRKIFKPLIFVIFMPLFQKAIYGRLGRLSKREWKRLLLSNEKEGIIYLSPIGQIKERLSVLYC